MDIPFNEEEDEEESGDNDGDDEGTWEFCNSDIREQAKRTCNSSDDQNHLCIFFILPKGPRKGSFLHSFSFSAMRVN